jgi:hypothetical protein
MVRFGLVISVHYRIQNLICKVERWSPLVLSNQNRIAPTVFGQLMLNVDFTMKNHSFGGRSMQHQDCPRSFDGLRELDHFNRRRVAI